MAATAPLFRSGGRLFGSNAAQWAERGGVAGRFLGAARLSPIVFKILVYSLLWFRWWNRGQHGGRWQPPSERIFPPGRLPKANLGETARPVPSRAFPTTQTKSGLAERRDGKTVFRSRLSLAVGSKRTFHSPFAVPTPPTAHLPKEKGENLAKVYFRVGKNPFEAGPPTFTQKGFKSTRQQL